MASIQHYSEETDKWKKKLRKKGHEGVEREERKTRACQGLNQRCM